MNTHFKIIIASFIHLFFLNISSANECSNHYSLNTKAESLFSALVPINLSNLLTTEYNLIKIFENGPQRPPGLFGFLKKKQQLPAFLEILYSKAQERLISMGQAKTQLSSLKTSELNQLLSTISLDLLKAYKPVDSTDKRLDSISASLARSVLNSIYRHPVASPYSNKYDQVGTEIGYCFGRATYFHEMLLTLGVDEKSIKKVWVVGPMVSGSITWQFHVATSVKLETGEWVVLDSNFNDIVSVEGWYNENLAYSPNKDLRLFITDAEKFTHILGKYNPVDMGLKKSKTTDWYKGFFNDLQDWFKKMIPTHLQNTDEVKLKNKALADFLQIETLPSKPNTSDLKNQPPDVKPAENNSEPNPQQNPEEINLLRDAYGIDLT